MMCLGENLTYQSQDYGTAAGLLAAMHLPSLRAEVPPRWYRAVGVVRYRPSSLSLLVVGCVKQSSFRRATWMISLSRPRSAATLATRHYYNYHHLINKYIVLRGFTCR